MIKEYGEFGFGGSTKRDKAKFDVRSLRLGRLYDDPCYDSDEDNDGVMTGLTKLFIVKKL